MRTTQEKTGKGRVSDLNTIAQLRVDENMEKNLNSEVDAVKNKQKITHYSMNLHVVRGLGFLKELGIFNHDIGNYDLLKVARIKAFLDCEASSQDLIETT